MYHTVFQFPQKSKRNIPACLAHLAHTLTQYKHLSYYIELHDHGLYENNSNPLTVERGGLNQLFQQTQDIDPMLH